MDDLRLGLAVRAVRRRQGLLQRDVARRARVSPNAVSRLERGGLEAMPLMTARRICTSLGVVLDIAPRWRGADLARLLDHEHAAAVEWLTRRLAGTGWEVQLEFTFNHYGERGSVDIVAWQPSDEALLVIEAKTRLADVQALLASLDRKRRIVPAVFARERRVRVRSLGLVLAVVDSGTARRRVAEHTATFAVAMPARTVEVRRWLARPRGPCAGIWFLPRTPLTTLSSGRGGPDRVQRRLPTSR